jgi:hypothetical protein
MQPGWQAQQPNWWWSDASVGNLDHLADLLGMGDLEVDDRVGWKRDDDLAAEHEGLPVRAERAA